MSKIDSFPLSDTDDRELIKKHPVPSLDLWDFKACREVLKNYQDFFVWMSKEKYLQK